MFTKNRKSLVSRFVLVVVLLSVMIGTKPIESAHAATLVVTNTNDSGTGSLRQAIADAVNGDMITFDPSLGYYSIINLFSSLVIDKDLIIDASNLANPLRMDFWNAGNLQVLNSTVAISNLIFQRGYSNGDGGAIWSNGSLILIDSSIEDSHATGSGGAIYTSGSLTLQNAALDNNQSGLNGAGIYAETSGDQILVANTTISKNYAYGDGGGIYAAGSSILKLFNTTVVQNGGKTDIVSQDTSELMFYNSVVSCHSKSSCTDLHEPPLISNSIVGLPGEYYGLGELADNGGPSKTIAILTSSPLVDAGDESICADPLVNNTDQRGVTRPYGSHCDIGAFELEYLTISGNSGVDGAVLMHRYGLFTTADDNGDYSIKVLPGWSGAVVPVKSGYSFSPAKQDYVDVQTDQAGQDYTATLNTYTLSANAGDTWRVSVASDGAQSDDDSYDPSISADGRYIAFMSYASNIINNDISGATDILVHDNQTGETEVVSIHSNGVQFENNSYMPSISADGRYVAFMSYEWFYTPVIFVHDRHTGLTHGLPFRGPPEYSSKPSLSADGRYITYMSNGVLTDEGDTNNKVDIFVYDQWTGSLKRVSLSSNAVQANGDSMFSSISTNGHYVVFQSSATNLVEGDTNGVEDIFVRNIQADETIRVSVDSGNVQANGNSFFPSISWDGRFVTFYSSATNLVANDTNGVADVFVHDLQNGETIRVSVGSNGLQANGPSDRARISSDGRFVAFRSYATNLIANDTNGTADIFIHDRQTGETKRASVSALGAQANGASPLAYSSDFALAGDGKYLAFSSDATNLVNDDTNGRADIFVRDVTSDVPILSFTSVASADGWILESTETSGVGGAKNNTVTTLRVGDDAANKQYRAVLSFNTPALPEGAVIASVTLKFKHAGVSGTNPFRTHGKLLVDICQGSYKGNPALQLGDFKAACGKNKALIYTNSKVDNWYSQSLNPLDFDLINLGGVTQFRLRFARDDNNDFSADFLKIFSGDATIEADRPQLVIEYYVP